MNAVFLILAGLFFQLSLDTSKKHAENKKPACLTLLVNSRGIISTAVSIHPKVAAF
jgi:hypothetical protein